jgi:hypothetical protein
MDKRVKVLIADGLAEEGIAALKKISQIELEVHSALERSALKEKIKETKDLSRKAISNVEFIKNYARILENKLTKEEKRKLPIKKKNSIFLKYLINQKKKEKNDHKQNF